MPLDLPLWPERLIHALRLCIPYGLLALFFTLDVISFQIPPFGNLRPDLTIIAIFYWSIYRPTLIPNWFVFFLGLAMDLISGLPVGLNALIYLLVNWIISDQRRVFVGQPFVTRILGFSLVMVSANALRWGLFGLLYTNWPPLMPIGASIALGVLLFPFVTVLLHMTHKLLPHQPVGGMPPV